MDKKNWNVTMRCVVTKHVHLANCTEDEARNKPWEFADDEREMDMADWDVTNIEVDD